MAKRRKMTKPQIKRAHKIAKKIARSGGARNPYAVAMAKVKKKK